VGATDAESAAVVESAAMTAATMTAAAMTAAAVTTPMGGRVVRRDETERKAREKGAEDFVSSCHDSLRLKLPVAVWN
jgi:hypothetical protein